MNSALVSILIPCFNAEQYVASAIESALGQDYPDFEVIVVDDGSTDASLEIIRRFGADRRIRFETGPNRGGSAARNRLLAMANGKFVQFLDADDLLDPRKIRLCMNAMDDEADAVICGFIERRGDTERAIVPDDPGDDLPRWFIEAGVGVLIPLHRVSCLRAADGFDESLPCCQEYEMHLRLACAHWRRVVRVVEPLCTIVKVDGSVSSNEARVFSHQVRILTDVHRVLRDSDQLTPTRAEALAQAMYVCGRHLARHGMNDQSAAAFALSRIIDPNAVAPVRWPMRALTRAIGPVRAERTRVRIRQTVGADDH